MESDLIFISALRAVDRSACRRWVQAQGVAREDAEGAEAARRRWEQLPLLGDPALRALALQKLCGALGRDLGPEAFFPSMVWYRGAQDTYDGVRFTGTLADFVDHVLVARSREVADKRCGWVVTPTSNSDGHRTNASTTAVHALNLDCDGRGAPDRLIAVLDQLGVCYVLYQSGGWSPATPKWHVLLPLDAPFDTSSPEKIDAWKAAYNWARVVFGALAELPGEGFDPTVETPCVPVFVTERRRPEDPSRQVRWRTGRALDLQALVRSLPAVVDDERERAEHLPAASVVLDDDRLEEIVRALCEPMQRILSGRRDLYLALPGALLDRGLSPDDVRQIVEEVSLRCPGDPTYTQADVDARHREHVHCAETTIAKFERGETYTRIGTLNEGWREVAGAVDEVLPPPFVGALLAKLEERAARGPAARAATAVATATAGDVASTPDLIERAIRQLRGKKMRSETFDQKVRGVVLDALLKGEDMVPYVPGPDGEPSPVRDSEGEPYDRERVISMAASMLAYKLRDEALPPSEPFAPLRKFFFERSARAMVREGEGRDVVESLLRSAEGAFMRALNKKVRRDEQERTEQQSKAAARCAIREARRTSK